MLAGCATKMPEIDYGQQALEAYDRVDAIIAKQEPVEGAIGLYEAMARALKYNLDEKIEEASMLYRTEQMESVRLGMLPIIQGNAQWGGRSNKAASSSESLRTGTESLEPSFSSPQQGYTADLTASWSLLDFGFAYIQSQQAEDELTIARQQRRKVINRILEDVRTSYWRAVSAERTQQRLLKLEADAIQALGKAQELEQRGRVSPLVVLAYQRELLQIQANVQKLQRELLLSKRQLAALMNLSPNERFSLELPSRSEVAPDLPGSATQMVLIGLRYRSELAESFLRRRINEKEQQLALVKALPSFTSVFGLNYDSNPFLYNNQWQSYSARVSWDLMSLFRYPSERDAAKGEGNLLLARENSLVMAIMTQIHVARARFIRMSHELRTIRLKHEVQSRILQLSQSQANVGFLGQQDLVKEYMTSILTEVEYDAAFADLQNAYANLYASMGLDNFAFDPNSGESVTDLAARLEDHWTEQAITLPEPPKRIPQLDEQIEAENSASMSAVGGQGNLSDAEFQKRLQAFLGENAEQPDSVTDPDADIEDETDDDAARDESLKQGNDSDVSFDRRRLQFQNGDN